MSELQAIPFGYAISLMGTFGFILYCYSSDFKFKRMKAKEKRKLDAIRKKQERKKQ